MCNVDTLLRLATREYIQRRLPNVLGRHFKNADFSLFFKMHVNHVSENVCCPGMRSLAGTLVSG